MEEKKLMTETDVITHIFGDVRQEWAKSNEKHGDIPDDIIHQAAIMAEEAGEVIKASVQYTYERGKIGAVKKELIQTAAMCVKMLLKIEKTHGSTQII